jgi:ubiquinone/menaquinone biosynthesis C-methylase UbiE
MSRSDVNQFTEVAEIYDDLMSVVPYGWWTDYVQRLWTLFGVMPFHVLDLACGTGNVTRELMRRGYHAEGADASEAMLTVARRKLGEGVPLWHQDATGLDVPTRPFDACVCLFDSLNYILEVADLRRALRAVHDHLGPGGIFIFDMNAIRALETGMFNQRGTGRDSSLEYEWHSAWEPITRLCTIRMEFHVCDGGDDWRTLYETHVQRGYTQAEITGALNEVGFDIVSAYDAFTTRPPTARSDRYHFVAQRGA